MNRLQSGIIVYDRANQRYGYVMRHWRYLDHNTMRSLRSLFAIQWYDDLINTEIVDEYHILKHYDIIT